MPGSTEAGGERSQRGPLTSQQGPCNPPLVSANPWLHSYKETSSTCVANALISLKLVSKRETQHTAEWRKTNRFVGQLSFYPEREKWAISFMRMVDSDWLPRASQGSSQWHLCWPLLFSFVLVQRFLQKCQNAVFVRSLGMWWGLQPQVAWETNLLEPPHAEVDSIFNGLPIPHLFKLFLSSLFLGFPL